VKSVWRWLETANAFGRTQAGQVVCGFVLLLLVLDLLGHDGRAVDPLVTWSVVAYWVVVGLRWQRSKRNRRPPR